MPIDWGRELNAEMLASRKDTVREMYERLSLKSVVPALTLAPYRDAAGYDAYVMATSSRSCNSPFRPFCTDS